MPASRGSAKTRHWATNLSELLSVASVDGYVRSTWLDGLDRSDPLATNPAEPGRDRIRPSPQLWWTSLQHDSCIRPESSSHRQRWAGGARRGHLLGETRPIAEYANPESINTSNAVSPVVVTRVAQPGNRGNDAHGPPLSAVLFAVPCRISTRQFARNPGRQSARPLAADAPSGPTTLPRVRMRRRTIGKFPPFN